MYGRYLARQASAKASQSAAIPLALPKALHWSMRLPRQSTTVPKTSKMSAFTPDASMVAPHTRVNGWGHREVALADESHGVVSTADSFSPRTLPYSSSSSSSPPIMAITAAVDSASSGTSGARVTRPVVVPPPSVAAVTAVSGFTNWVRR